MAVPALSGCVEDVIPEMNESEEIAVKEGEKDTISESQKKLIEEEMDTVTPEDAVKSNKDDVIVEELPSKKIKVKETYTDLNEFSNFIADSFFNYHSQKITGAEFLKLISPHLHEYFIEQLPTDKDAQIDMFNNLQELFTKSLSSEIKSFVITAAEDTTTNEATFYRKYTLEDNSTLYYETTVKLEKGHWLLVDDVPTVSYEKEGGEE